MTMFAGDRPKVGGKVHGCDAGVAQSRSATASYNASKPKVSGQLTTGAVSSVFAYARV